MAAEETLAVPSTLPETRRGWRSVLRRNGWLVADQALVSGFNFLTSAVLARMLGVHNYGIFSIFYIILQYFNSIQISTILSPMLTIAPQIHDEGRQRKFLRGMAGSQGFFSLGCAVAFCLILLAGGLRSFPYHFDHRIAVPFVLTIVFFQLQDWLRRFWYARESGKAVFFNDVISYVGQLAALLFLWKIHLTTVGASYYAVALTSLAAFLAGAFKEDIWATLTEVRASMRRAWIIGKSLLVATQFQWLGSQGILLIAAATSGVAAASGMRAVVTLMGPVTLLYQLLDNVIPVRAARAFAMGGRPALVSYLRRSGIALALLVGFPLLTVVVARKPVMTLVFGKSFGIYSALVIWQAVYTFLTLPYRGMQYYHRTMGSTAVMARSALAVSIVSLVLCFVLARRYGAAGGMAALVIGQVLNVILPLRSAQRRNNGTEPA